jgi:hypothetical protein
VDGYRIGVGVDDLDATERRVLRALVDRVGLVAAARQLGVAREPVVRVLGGLGVRRGTTAIIRAALAALEDGRARAR